MLGQTTASNIEEVKAREGFVIAVTTEGDDEVSRRADGVISVPAPLEWPQPVLVAPALQLPAHHTGVFRGWDMDQPRNLAQSVTVE